MNDKKEMPATAMLTRGQRLKMIATDAARPVQTKTSRARSLASIHSSDGMYQYFFHPIMWRTASRYASADSSPLGPMSPWI